VARLPVVDIEDLDPDPHVQFDRWFAEAFAAGVPSPEVMALATATPHAVPSVRMVLLKGHDQRGFVFYTNRESRKATELKANPRAALALHWHAQNRQVRIEGGVDPLGHVETFAYFQTRPRGNKLAAWASPQSGKVETREQLERLFAETEERFAGDDIPLPPFWGGYCVVPDAIEFWQGQQDRLHDRVRYDRDGDGWSRARLAP
jgi:pyridoxamine 5'-phosphate oxidase